jgi:hypothetical protein
MGLLIESAILPVARHTASKMHIALCNGDWPASAEGGERGSGVANRITYLPGSFVSWCASNMALQHRLGLLSEQRIRAVVDYYAGVNVCTTKCALTALRAR